MIESAVATCRDVTGWGPKNESKILKSSYDEVFVYFSSIISMIFCFEDCVRMY